MNALSSYHDNLSNTRTPGDRGAHEDALAAEKNAASPIELQRGRPSIGIGSLRGGRDFNTAPLFAVNPDES